MTATDRTAWLAERQTGIGSSDAPNLVGVGFRTAADVYREKTEQPRPAATTGVLRRGLDLEPIVAARYAEVMGVELLIPAEQIARHRERTWQLASIDRARVDRRPVELKTVTGFGPEWGETGSADVPDGYRVQVQHQMGVLDADSCDLAALDVIAWEFRVYRVAFDADLFAWLTDVEHRFLRDHVMTLTPPGVAWERQFKAEAERRITVPGTRVVLPEFAAGLCDRRADLKSIEKEAKAEADAITEQLDALIADAEQATAGSWKLKRVTKKGFHRAACDVAESTYLDVRRGK